MLVEFIEEKGWMVLNGKVNGDEKGEYTFTGEREGTVIDFVWGDREVRERVERLKMGDRVDSDHQPVEIWIKGERERRREKREKRGG